MNNKIKKKVTYYNFCVAKKYTNIIHNLPLQPSNLIYSYTYFENEK